MSMARRLHDPNPRLWPRLLAGLYGALIRLRLWLYAHGWLKSRRLPAWVISVGNLTVGGTGKTPAVIMIARHLAARGWRAAVISRGYRGQSRESVNVVSDGRKVLLGPSQAGDEPVLMARDLPGVPVLTGRDRWTVGRFAIDRFQSDVLVMDDGFQHIALDRDVNLLLLDAAAPWGNGHLLPAGPLREPVSQADRATAFLLTRSDAADDSLTSELEKRFPGRPVFRGRHRPVRLTVSDGKTELTLDGLRGRRVLAFCGLARPDHFLSTLTGLGAEVALFIRWPDHYQPQDKDLRLIEDKARELGVIDAMTTAKDAVKLGAWLEARPSGATPAVWSLEVEMDLLDGWEEFWTMIEPPAAGEPEA